MAEHAAARSRGMSRLDYLEWRDALRADYRRAFPPSSRPACSSIGTGALFFMFDLGAKLSWASMSRAMSPDEWDSWRRSPMCERRRKLGEEHDS